jgi:UDP-N-acetylglucosamine diphosphorylase/glucosamine-1-phosphate N-acetyltransferase
LTPPLVLVDPPAAPFWPLAATRPVAEILAGTRTFRARWAAREGPVAALWCDLGVAGARLRGESPPPVGAWPDPAQGYRVALATWVPERGWRFGEESAAYRSGAESVAWRLSPEEARTLSETSTIDVLRGHLAELDLPAEEVGGRFLGSIWSVVDSNPDLVTADALDIQGSDTVTGVDPFVLLGDAAMLKVARGVTIGPFVVLDARGGPIVLDEGARIEPHAVLHGPLYVGRESVVLGDVVAGSSIGPQCKVHGDLEQSIVVGYSNKAHEGFVGHSVLGEWVNLGAGTTTSDLKNTYGSVRVEGPEGRVDTGLLKVGSFLADHVKTGIGSLLTTGARLGVATHFFGGSVSPPWLPHFSWHDGRERSGVRWDAFLRTTELAMARRGETMTQGERDILAVLHAQAGSS